MKLSYDQRHNIAYMRLAEATAEVETIQVGDDLNVDTAPSGKVYGIELLNANEQLESLISGTFTLENEATGISVEVTLP